jgi:hypothetical protein
MGTLPYATSAAKSLDGSVFWIVYYELSYSDLLGRRRREIGSPASLWAVDLYAQEAAPS